MKKNTIKAFTLVEMLIVIVIIGILIASLMPRMQSAQWRARDVARKNDLAQIQTAIITSQQDKWVWPGGTGANNGLAVWEIESQLLKAWMSTVPVDPNKSNKVSGVGTSSTVTYSWWQYVYMVSTRNGVADGWFVLMAKTEVEWWSNWIVCGSGTHGSDLTGWYIKTGTDLRYIQTCSSFEDATGANDCKIESWTCYYNDINQLRYILLY